MPQNPAHPPVKLSDSVPEPDWFIATQNPRVHFTRHPVPSEVPLVIEVPDSTLDRDRGMKKRIYARVAIPQYWLLDLVSRTIQSPNRFR